MTEEIILDVQNVTKQFPGITALSNVSIQFKRGEIHGLCGENGAGKSTLMKILAGVYPYGTYDGSVFYEGQELKLTSNSIKEARAEGIAIVYQELTLVPDMTVGENIFLGKEITENGVINWDKTYAECRKILEHYKLDVNPNDVVKHLGVGKMQMVEIAKALSENAKVLILDEPTSALTEAEIDKLMEILESLQEKGITSIYISHKLEEFFRITDSITVLRDGKTVITAPTKELSLEKLVSYMVGREMKERFPHSTRKPNGTIFEVQNLHAIDPEEPSREILKGVTFDLKRGEILGIAGLMGSGRTELVTTIFGEMGKITSGKMLLEGKEINIKSAKDAMEKGISLVPEDRKKQGLVLIQSILNNLSLPNLYSFSKTWRIDKNQELKSCLQQVKNLSIKISNIENEVNSLSGGNQQKVVIGKWLMTIPKILIMDDPTRGVDVGAKYEIYKLMNELAEKGVSIIMISSELEEVLGMSDRVMVMHEGRSNGILDITEATQEKIMALATGIA
ncbi:sugar ABC transporter ATP-binding protein [Leptolinea tardivitalis]|uniref:sugar ABC transporter ATP-binding protein n=1 Tax=Leptolinea tardivitalis TaxID=229920 RepID=UPI000B2FD58E|nr:ATP-binding cassette domain-containing protein [Leptolinea tardivitalis]GAP22028.1 xylose ABC transporter ATP-binding protein [Leptolinea tardivitalis]